MFYWIIGIFAYMLILIPLWALVAMNSKIDREEEDNA